MIPEIEFTTVAQCDEVPLGERLVVKIGRDWVVLFNVKGAFYAMEDRCSHADVPLSEGALTGMNIECIRHGSQFDIRTGEALNPPAVSPVRIYPVRVEEGAIQIGRRKR